MKTNDCKESYTLSFSDFEKDRVYEQEYEKILLFLGDFGLSYHVFCITLGGAEPRGGDFTATA